MIGHSPVAACNAYRILQVPWNRRCGARQAELQVVILQSLIHFMGILGWLFLVGAWGSEVSLARRPRDRSTESEWL